MKLRTRLFMLIAAALLLGSCAMIPGFVSEAQNEFEEGLALFNSGRYQESIPRFQRATDLDPNFGRAYLYLGRSYIGLKSWRQALTPLRTAYRLSRGNQKRGSGSSDRCPFCRRPRCFQDGQFRVFARIFERGSWAATNIRESEKRVPEGFDCPRWELTLERESAASDSAYTEAVKLSTNSFDAVFGLGKALWRNGEIFQSP
jgi:tetratricopeptide (TPR) repeat protein